MPAAVLGITRIGNEEDHKKESKEGQKIFGWGRNGWRYGKWARPEEQQLHEVVRNVWNSPDQCCATTRCSRIMGNTPFISGPGWWSCNYQSRHWYQGAGPTAKRTPACQHGVVYIGVCAHRFQGDSFLDCLPFSTGNNCSWTLTIRFKDVLFFSLLFIKRGIYETTSPAAYSILIPNSF